MKAISLGNDNFKMLFDPKTSGTISLTHKGQEGFVASKRFPGIAWLKSFSSSAKAANRLVRQQFVDRLRTLVGQGASAESTGIGAAVLTKIIKKLSTNSGRPITNKYLVKLASRTRYKLLDPQSKATYRKTKLVGLLGKRVGEKYRAHLNKKESEGKVGFLEKKFNGLDLDNGYMKEWQSQFSPTEEDLNKD